MEEDSSVAKRNNAWAPGTLDATRKAIGSIDPNEAREMQKKLGGEVMQERVEVVDEKSLPRKRGGYLHRESEEGKARLKANAKRATIAGEGSGGDAGGGGAQHSNMLPIIDGKFNSKIDRLMMSDSFGIKVNYGLFNFIRHLTGTQEKVHPQFVSITLKSFIDGIENFYEALKALCDVAPDTYKAKIAGEDDTKFRLLRIVSTWNIRAIRSAYTQVLGVGEPRVDVADLMGVVELMAKCIVTVYYYGTQRIPPLIKEIYADEAAYPNAKRDSLTKLAKDAVTSWMYIDSEVLYKLYPLIMRMCSDTYEEYVDFYASKMKRILDFVGLKKYDLLLPEKAASPVEKKVSDKAPVSEELENVETTGMSAEEQKVLSAGIALLERLFPKAGFDNLNAHVDLYPYFQPLYRFDDGFNMLSPENPLQTVVVLLRIIEDCIQGLRKVRFNPLESLPGSKDSGESVQAVFDDWSAYRENVFDKLYCEPLMNMVNSIYSQAEFENTQFCKKLKTSLLWQTTYHFLPHFKFTQLLLERPQDESKYRPLFMRTDYLRRYFTRAVAQCDEASPTKGIVSLIQNPWDRYVFSIQNEMSKRLDVLLGAKKSGPSTNANNAALLKYTLCIVSVLDWYINDAKSPAYEASPMSIFRISDKDGKPEFSAPLRSDQNRLFVESVKARNKG